MTYDTFKQLIRMATVQNISFPCDDCTFLFRQGKHSHVIPFKFINTTNGMYIDSFLYFRDDLVVRSKVTKRFATFWPLL